MQLILLIIAFIFGPIDVFSAPSVSAVTGTITSGQAVTISGSGFGSKSPAKPYLWAPFESSINPSSLGTITSWSDDGGMEYNATEGVGGTGCAKSSSNASNSWLMGVTATGFAWNDLGQQMYVFRKLKNTYAITGSDNYKDYRLWPSTGLGNTPDLHFSTSNGSFGVEGMAGGGYPINTSAARRSANTWGTEEFTLQSNSVANTQDATFKFWLNGALVGQMPYTDYMTHTYMLNDGGGAQMTINYVVHGVYAGASLPSDARYWVDDVYVDTTWARVMLGNASTLANSTHVEPQIPSSWSSTEITVTVNTGSFSANDSVYLFVVDSSGEVSPPSGPITVGAVQGVGGKISGGIGFTQGGQFR